MVASADSHPTKQSLDAFAEYSAEADAAMAALQSILDNDIPNLNFMIQSAELSPIVV